MSEVIVITSGKGGVGKTTTVANLGTALSLENKKTVVVDADIGLRNLDVVMGTSEYCVRLLPLSYRFCFYERWYQVQFLYQKHSQLSPLLFLR